jgi:CheY-like chemotaxis protein
VPGYTDVTTAPNVPEEDAPPPDDPLGSQPQVKEQEMYIDSPTTPVVHVEAPAAVRPDARRGRTVLMVEDNEDNRLIYATMLRHVGFDVREATDGAQGLEMAHSVHPDLILMDISLPRVDGWEATRRLKADPATRDIPVVALTAHALPSDRARAAEVGCDAYLAKPCAPQDVASTVSRLLAR